MGRRGGGGGGGGGSSSGSSSVSIPGPSPEEQELRKLDLELRKAIQPQLLEFLPGGFKNVLLPASRAEFPLGIFGQIGRGLTPEFTSEMITRTLNALEPRLEPLGLLDSGVRAELSRKAVQDVLLAGEQERIRQLENLLGLAVGFPPSASVPVEIGSQLQQRFLSERLGQPVQTSQQTISQPGGRRGSFLGGFAGGFARGFTPFFLPGRGIF